MAVCLQSSALQCTARLDELDEAAPRVLIATGRLVGEGFDHPPLDTLFLAMPISWKGTLKQYAGRLHREHSLKQHVRIYDYYEHDHPQLARMWNKRLSGYKSMGYEVVDQPMDSKIGISPLSLIWSSDYLPVFKMGLPSRESRISTKRRLRLCSVRSAARHSPHAFCLPCLFMTFAAFLK